MAVTHTATAARPEFIPPRNHVGVNVITGNYVVQGSLSGSASGLILLCKIPGGATITRFMERHEVAGADTLVVDFGLRYGDGGEAGSTSIAVDSVLTAGAAATWNNGNIPLAVSVFGGGEASGTKAETFKYLTAQKDSGTNTASQTFRYVVEYVF